MATATSVNKLCNTVLAALSYLSDMPRKHIWVWSDKQRQRKKNWLFTASALTTRPRRLGANLRRDATSRSLFLNQSVLADFEDRKKTHGFKTRCLSGTSNYTSCPIHRFCIVPMRSSVRKWNLIDWINTCNITLCREFALISEVCQNPPYFACQLHIFFMSRSKHFDTHAWRDPLLSKTMLDLDQWKRNTLCWQAKKNTECLVLFLFFLWIPTLPGENTSNHVKTKRSLHANFGRFWQTSKIKKKVPYRN